MPGHRRAGTVGRDRSYPGRGDASMATHVRIRNGAHLRSLVGSAGTQRDVARAAGMTFQRLNALISEVRPVIAVEQAARLEDTLRVPRGTLFAHDTPELLAPYVGERRSGAA